MTGQEAINEGFADEMIEGDVSAGITEDKKTVISNGIRFPAEAFQSLPENLNVLENRANHQEEGGNVAMTKQELVEKYPDVYNAIVQEVKDGQKQELSDAVMAERNRIRDIDEIAGAVGDETMVREAKFGEKPLNASELALAALKKQNELGAAFLSEMKDDAEASETDGVNPAPNSGTKSKEEQELQDIMEGAALIIGKKGE